MKKFWADLHIHTVLSPCASLEMSPRKIVLEAVNKNLDIIGITDHNSTKNCKAVVEAAKEYNLFVLCGVEITTREEVHCLAFFETLDLLKKFQLFIDGKIPAIKNDEEKFGLQVVVDNNEHILEMEENLLTVALNSGISEIEHMVHKMNGIFIPAHVNKQVNSIFSQLAFIPPGLHIDALGLNSYGVVDVMRGKYVIEDNLTFVKSSDAHYLNDIGKVKTAFYMTKPQFSEIKLAIQNKLGRYIQIV